MIETYKITKSFPKEEVYGLISQLRRAAVSIATNIVEGTGRSGNADFSRFLHIAYGSTKELEYEFLLSKDLGYLTDESFNEIVNKIEEVNKMLSGLMKTVRAENKSAYC